jgi:hypothetical protein
MAFELYTPFVYTSANLVNKTQHSHNCNDLILFNDIYLRDIVTRKVIFLIVRLTAVIGQAFFSLLYVVIGQTSLGCDWSSLLYAVAGQTSLCCDW